MHNETVKRLWVVFHECSTIVFILMLPLAEGRAGDVWEYYVCLRALGRQVLLHYIRFGGLGLRTRWESISTGILTLTYIGMSLLFDSVTEIFFPVNPLYWRYVLCCVLAWWSPLQIGVLGFFFKGGWSALSQCCPITKRCIPECQLYRHKRVTLMWVM